ncbi:MAG: hypothetical protein IIW48_02855 [Clostridia bacterium]|nr:hypothetical protein [Clostridia bacterium]
MKLLKSFLSIFVVTIVFSVCALHSFAQDEYFDNQIESIGANELFDCLDDEQIKMLKELGISEIDINTLVNISPRAIFDLFFEVVTGQYVTPLKTAVTVGITVVCLAVALQFLTNTEKISRMVNVLCVAVIGIIVLMPLSGCLSRVISAIELSSKFMVALIPVLAVLLTIAGNPTAALSYNSLCFVAAQFVAFFSSDFISPMIRVTLSLSIFSGINDELNFEKLVEYIKKIIIFLMSFFSTVFITMLTLKGMLSGAADGVAVRGVRFLIGNLVPFIGGAVSDAYTSIFGTLKLVKNTVAVFAITAVSVINIPVFIECICWILSFSFLSMLSDMLSMNKVSLSIRAISSCLVILTVLLLFVAIVFVLSIGLVMLINST